MSTLRKADSLKYDVLIVGAGHGGGQAAIALRQRRFVGTIALLGEELDAPYDRPTLSKDYLAGEKRFERILLRTAQFWIEREVALILGRTVASVDPEAGKVTLADGAAVGYGKLIWAAGGSPRRLSCPGHGLTGVHSIRNRGDVDRIVDELPNVVDVVVIGAGYLGLEVAAVLIKLGKKVTVVEALSRVLARVAGDQLSGFYEAEHRLHGVDIRTGVTVKSIEEREGRVAGVRLADGELLPAELVVVSIGIVPSDAPLIEAGAAGGNGVNVDAFCRTSLREIYAIGDCAAHESRFAGGRMIRLESIQNANDQAITAARAIIGDPACYDEPPWFWSTQYDLKLQTIGLSTGFDDTVLRGDPATRSFSVIYLRAGRVIALDCVNMTKDFVHGKALVKVGAVLDRKLLADASVPLKDLKTCTSRIRHDGI